LGSRVPASGQGRETGRRSPPRIRSKRASPPPSSGTISATRLPASIRRTAGQGESPPAIDGDNLAGNEVGLRVGQKQHQTGNVNRLATLFQALLSSHCIAGADHRRPVLRPSETIAPGLTALTRAPRGPSSRGSIFASPGIAPFEATVLRPAEIGQVPLDVTRLRLGFPGEGSTMAAPALYSDRGGSVARRRGLGKMPGRDPSFRARLSIEPSDARASSGPLVPLSFSHKRRLTSATVVCSRPHRKHEPLPRYARRCRKPAANL
jgi:hypothetical protein